MTSITTVVVVYRDEEATVQLPYSGQELRDMAADHGYQTAEELVMAMIHEGTVELPGPWYDEAAARIAERSVNQTPRQGPQMP